VRSTTTFDASGANATRVSLVGIGWVPSGVTSSKPDDVGMAIVQPEASGRSGPLRPLGDHAGVDGVDDRAAVGGVHHPELRLGVGDERAPAQRTAIRSAVDRRRRGECPGVGADLLGVRVDHRRAVGARHHQAIAARGDVARGDGAHLEFVAVGGVAGGEVHRDHRAVDGDQHGLVAGDHAGTHRGVRPVDQRSPAWSNTLMVASLPTFCAVITTSSSTARARPGKNEGWSGRRRTARSGSCRSRSRARRDPTVSIATWRTRSGPRRRGRRSRCR
jgi:hypothetical protein